MKRYLSLAALIASMTAVHGATYYFGTANQTSGQHWEQASYWWSNANHTGSHPASVSSADDFVINANLMRTQQGGGTSTFTGNSLSIIDGSYVPGGAYSGGTLLTKNRIVSITNLTTNAGRIANGENDSGQSTVVDVNVTNWTMEGFGLLFSSQPARSINASVTTITGAGILYLDGGSFSLNLTNATTHTGGIHIADGNLDFANDVVSGGALTLDTGTITTLNQDLTFTGLTIGGSALAPATYSFADLNSSYDSFFADGGSGSITVVPEPGAYALLMAGGSLFMLILFRRKQK